MTATNGNLTSRLKDRIAAWQEQAEQFEKHGCAEAAATYRIAADDLEKELQDCGDTALNLTQAAQESGYSREHLGRMVRDEKLPNAGRPSGPKIRRRDLPIKSKSLLTNRDGLHSPLTSKDDVVRSVVTQGKGAR